MDSLTNTMLKQIIQLNKSFIPAEDLISFLSVSDRTVYNYWKKIEKFLQDYHINIFFPMTGKVLYSPEITGNARRLQLLFPIWISMNIT